MRLVPQLSPVIWQVIIPRQANPSQVLIVKVKGKRKVETEAQGSRP